MIASYSIAGTQPGLIPEMGLLRASFVPPKAIRDLRDYTRMRTRLTQERTRCFQRLEKLLESALVKLSSVASKLTTISAQDMIKAMAAGQRDPQILASLARTNMKAKREELAEALDGMFDDHHGELAGLLLDHVAFLDERIKVAVASGPPGWPRRCPPPGESTPTGPPARRRNRAGRHGLARRGPARGDPRRQPRPGPGHHRGNRPGHDPVPHRRPPGVLGRAMPLRPPVRSPHPSREEGPGQHLAAQRPRPGRQRRPPHPDLPRRAIPPHRPPPRQDQGPGRRRPLHPGYHLAPAEGSRLRFTDLGPGYYQARLDTDRKLRNHIRQIQALGFAVTITKPA